MQLLCKIGMRTDRAAVDKSILHDQIADSITNDLTEKEAKFVEAFTTQPTASLQTVAKAAGYHGRSLSHTPYQMIRKTKIRKAIATAFKKLGLTPEYWAWKLKDAAEAESLVWVGGERVKVPDHKQRLAATRMALELRGAFDPVPQGAAGQTGGGQSITLNVGFKNSWEAEKDPRKRLDTATVVTTP